MWCGVTMPLAAKGPQKRFHLNGNTVGIHRQTQKFELHVHGMSPQLTLSVKGLRRSQGLLEKGY